MHKYNEKAYTNKHISIIGKTMIRGRKVVITVCCSVPGFQNIAENNVDIPGSQTMLKTCKLP